MIRGVLTFLAVLAVLAAGASYLLPRQYEVQRTLRIDAAPREIQVPLIDLCTWPEWTAWSRALDPEATWSHSGPPTGMGGRMSWRGPRLGSGELQLNKAEPLRGIKYRVVFGGGETEGSGAIRLRAEGTGTEVTWTARGSLGGNPLQRLQGLLVDGPLGADLERSLAGLKARMEGEAVPTSD